jgi:protein CpxP
MKNMSKVSMLAIATLLAGALTIPFAFGQSGGEGQGGQQSEQGKRSEGRGFGRRHGQRGGGMEGRMFSRLNLTDAQKEQMKQINQNFRDRTKSLHDELRAKHQELRQLQSGATFDEALATQKLTEIASVQSKLMGERFKLRQEMTSILTPEQKTQFEQLREQMKTRRNEFKPNRGERRAGKTL